MPRTYTQLHYHVVFATRHRVPFLSAELVRHLYPLFGAIVRDQGGVVLAVGGMPDHVHLVVGLRAHPSLAAVVKAIKGCASHWINQNARPPEPFAWQEGYAAFTLSPSVLRKALRYVEQQEAHHRRLGFETEMEQLLRRHGLAISATDLDF
ncbi:MAG TPA: IS200/IS605 family transposase [Thermoanaerobaculia bacterium]|nr:IS200/IS605 family transposase [Thermoanaerobaculia bacterium]